ncbi:hypothetical protein JTE90_017800 [Oedothorax gibbosus]|uniref:Pectinesterase n=1 Tax=Oedothorax gibbosus TaxID=931172 RepID=A0AAV6U6U3_9ARAC|nr:hypothetical protein JTE90_017800 [Oedothorax gibbosus]
MSLQLRNTHKPINKYCNQRFQRIRVVPTYVVGIHGRIFSSTLAFNRHHQKHEDLSGQMTSYTTCIRLRLHAGESRYPQAKTNKYCNCDMIFDTAVLLANCDMIFDTAVLLANCDMIFDTAVLLANCDMIFDTAVLLANCDKEPVHNTSSLAIGPFDFDSK